jgi:anti-sigma-K factor RskA
VNLDRFTELAPDYALGLLEGEELDEFERHLASGCAACESELASMDAVGDALAFSLPVAQLPDALRGRVMAAVQADLEAELKGAEKAALAQAIEGTPADRRKADGAVAAAPGTPTRQGVPAIEPTYAPSPAPWPPRPAVVVAPERRPGFFERLMPALAFAGVLAAALSGGWAWKTQQQLALVRADLERVSAENLQLSRVLQVVESPRLQVVALGGQQPAPQSKGRVLWSPDKREAVFYAYDLPAPPAGKDYQLWVFESGTPRSEGVFPVDASGRATHVLPEVPSPDVVGAFAVTLEPAGGVPQPTGDIFLHGAVTAKVN